MPVTVLVDDLQGRELFAFLILVVILFSGAGVFLGYYFSPSAPARTVTLTPSTQTLVTTRTTTVFISSTVTSLQSASSVNSVISTTPSTTEPILQWGYNAGSGLTSAVVASDGTVYFGINGSRLVALQPENGLVKWSSSVPRIQAILIANGGTIIVSQGWGTTNHQTSLIAINPQNGMIEWNHSSPFLSSSSTIMSSDGKVIYSTGDGTTIPIGGGGYVVNDTLYAISALNGSVLWSSTDLLGSPHYPCGINPRAAVGADGTIYAQSLYCGLNVVAINPKNGTVEWQDFSQAICSMIRLQVGPNGTIFGINPMTEQSSSPNFPETCDPSGLFALSPKNGNLLWKITGASYLAIGEDGDSLHFTITSIESQRHDKVERYRQL